VKHIERIIMKAPVKDTLKYAIAEVTKLAAKDLPSFYGSSRQIVLWRDWLDKNGFTLRQESDRNRNSIVFFADSKGDVQAAVYKGNNVYSYRGRLAAGETPRPFAQYSIAKHPVEDKAA
jgi:hypothetical protein